MEKITWTGKNLKEVLEFTGKYKRFDEWFGSFEEYEKYVKAHHNIFKLFNEDGSNFEIGPGNEFAKVDNKVYVLPRVGQKVYFAEEKRPYTIKACDDRFLICTKPYNLRKNTVLYTIVDIVEGIRGTDGYSLGPYDYTTTEDCEAFLKELQEGEKIRERNKIAFNQPDGIIEDIGAGHISYRNRIGLNITKII